MKPRALGRALPVAALLLAACSGWRWDAASFCAGTDPARCFEARGACVLVTGTVSSDPACIRRALDASPACAASGYYTWDADLAQGCDGAGVPRRAPPGRVGARIGSPAVLRARVGRARSASASGARSRASSRRRATSAAT